jgi:hypothetical protein
LRLAFESAMVVSNRSGDCMAWRKYAWMILLPSSILASSGLIV